MWSGNVVCYSVNLLASVTANRISECLDLKRSELFPDHIHVDSRWNVKYGSDQTKTKRIDDIPIPLFVFDVIVSWCLWEGYVFSLSRGARPVNGNRVLDALYKALAKIGISREEADRRNIKFYSWRAFANTYFRSRGIADS